MYVTVSLLLFSTTTLFGRPATKQASPRVVYTSAGALRAVIISRPGLRPVEAFRGVRYATAERFRRPTSTTRGWKNVRLASDFGPVCPQRIPDIDQARKTRRKSLFSVSIFSAPRRIPDMLCARGSREIPDMINARKLFGISPASILIPVMHYKKNENKKNQKKVLILPVAKYSRHGSTVADTASRTSAALSQTRHVSWPPRRRLSEP